MMERFYRQQSLMEFLSTKQGRQELNMNVKNYIINKSQDSTLGLAVYSEEIPVNSTYLSSCRLVYPYVEIYPNSPAEKAGMKNGMRIVGVNRKLVNKDLNSFKEILDAILKSNSFTELSIVDSKFWNSLMNHSKLIDFFSIISKKHIEGSFTFKKIEHPVMPVIFNNKYKKMKLIGSGTFGKVI